ncbi:hypothetical protein BD779DRAFT_1548665 [Infundibulicybe gibba]|nr:hypothetical protein BD779DRAFT_1548665 [Infundibulicybe gibba]
MYRKSIIVVLFIAAITGTVLGFCWWGDFFHFTASTNHGRLPRNCICPGHIHDIGNWCAISEIISDRSAQLKLMPNGSGLSIQRSVHAANEREAGGHGKYNNQNGT